LPGKPDIVFPVLRTAIFVDGDFWHGYHFCKWGKKLPEYWKRKIETNQRRDRRNFQKLRRRGWFVIRIWEHSIKKNLSETIETLLAKLERRKKELAVRHRKAKRGP
jgi:DNA mismatch endonuclease (patch repair protein)